MDPRVDHAPAAGVTGGRARHGAAVLGLAGAVTVLVLAAARSSAAGVLGVPQAVILGAVEGVTEFLPVSSTGHLIVTQRLLGLGRTPESISALDSYAVVIQGGAILAVAWLFWGRLAGVVRAVGAAAALPGCRRVVRPADRRLAVAIVVAAAPAGVLGLALGDQVRRHLFAPGPIALAWAAGGLVLLAVAGRLRPAPAAGERGPVPLDFVTLRQAAVIGLAQALALWPGVSRSLVTIAAGCVVGLALPAAVELSFLVGFFVLLGAAAVALLRDGGAVVAAFGWVSPLLGLVVAFVCATAAIRWLVGVVSGRSLAALGWYRLGAAAATLALLAAGRI